MTKFEFYLRGFWWGFTHPFASREENWSRAERAMRDFLYGDKGDK